MTEKCPTPGESWGTFNFGKKKGRSEYKTSNGVGALSLGFAHGCVGK